MITCEEKTTIEEFVSEWKNFKNLRAKKRFDEGENEGWISMLKRENMLDFALSILNKFVKDPVFCEQ